MEEAQIEMPKWRVIVSKAVIHVAATFLPMAQCKKIVAVMVDWTIQGSKTK